MLQISRSWHGAASRAPGSLDLIMAQLNKALIDVWKILIWFLVNARCDLWKAVNWRRFLGSQLHGRQGLMVIKHVNLIKSL